MRLNWRQTSCNYFDMKLKTNHGCHHTLKSKKSCQADSEPQPWTKIMALDQVHDSVTHTA